MLAIKKIQMCRCPSNLQMHQLPLRNDPWSCHFKCFATIMPSPSLSWSGVPDDLSKRFYSTVQLVHDITRHLSRNLLHFPFPKWVFTLDQCPLFPIVSMDFLDGFLPALFESKTLWEGELLVGGIQSGMVISPNRSPPMVFEGDSKSASRWLEKWQQLFWWPSSICSHLKMGLFALLLCWLWILWLRWVLRWWHWWHSRWWSRPSWTLWLRWVLRWWHWWHSRWWRRPSWWWWWWGWWVCLWHLGLNLSLQCSLLLLNPFLLPCFLLQLLCPVHQCLAKTHLGLSLSLGLGFCFGFWLPFLLTNLLILFGKLLLELIGPFLVLVALEVLCIGIVLPQLWNNFREVSVKIINLVLI